MQWYLKAFRQYADFSGRARRTEYWMFVLFNAIALIVLMILDNVLGLASSSAGDGMVSFNGGVLTWIYLVATLVPSLALGARRLHDTGKSGWLQLLNIIPFIGAIVLIVFFAIAGDPQPNKYGINPKQAAGLPYQPGQPYVA